MATKQRKFRPRKGPRGTTVTYNDFLVGRVELTFNKQGVAQIHSEAEERVADLKNLKNAPWPEKVSTATPDTAAAQEE